MRCYRPPPVADQKIPIYFSTRTKKRGKMFGHWDTIPYLYGMEVKEKQIKAITRATAQLLSDEMELALQGIAKKYGVKITSANGSFDSTKFTSKFSVVVLDADGGDAHAKDEWNMCCRSFNLKDNLIGKKFTSGGDKFVIVKLKPRGRRTPVVARKIGTQLDYRFPVNMLPAKFIR